MQCQELEDYLTEKGAKFSSVPDGELCDRFLLIIQNSHLIFHNTELTQQGVKCFIMIVGIDDAICVRVSQVLVESLPLINTGIS